MWRLPDSRETTPPRGVPRAGRLSSPETIRAVQIVMLRFAPGLVQTDNADGIINPRDLPPQQ